MLLYVLLAVLATAAAAARPLSPARVIPVFMRCNCWHGCAASIGYTLGEPGLCDNGASMPGQYCVVTMTAALGEQRRLAIAVPTAYATAVYTVDGAPFFKLPGQKNGSYYDHVLACDRADVCAFAPEVAACPALAGQVRIDPTTCCATVFTALFPAVSPLDFDVRRYRRVVAKAASRFGGKPTVLVELVGATPLPNRPACTAGGTALRGGTLVRTRVDFNDYWKDWLQSGCFRRGFSVEQWIPRLEAFLVKDAVPSWMREAYGATAFAINMTRTIPLALVEDYAV